MADPLLGSAKDFPGQTITVSHRHYKPNGNRFITVNITATSVNGVLGQTIGPRYYAANGNNSYLWSNVQFTTNEATGSWAVGDAFTVTANVSNQFSNYAASIVRAIAALGLPLASQVSQLLVLVTSKRAIEFLSKPRRSQIAATIQSFKSRTTLAQNMKLLG